MLEEMVGRSKDTSENKMTVVQRLIHKVSDRLDQTFTFDYLETIRTAKTENLMIEQSTVYINMLYKKYWVSIAFV